MNKKISCDSNIDKLEYKFEDVFAGTKCPNKPTAFLKVKYINKTGSFCKQHTEDLLQLELAEIIFEDSCRNNSNSKTKPQLKEMAI